MRFVFRCLCANQQSSKVARPALLAAILMAAAASARAQSTNVVISQVYGGGGATAGAPAHDQDYVELFNRGPAAVDLSAWSVQYADATGVTWSKTDLTGTIAPGQYILIGEAVGTVGNPLPVLVDVTGTIDLSPTTGKIALVNNQSVLPSQACFDQGLSGVVDIVGYGSGANGTNCSEGAAAPMLSYAAAAFRAFGGCQDTNNNSVDFAADAPLPRNSAAPFNNNCVPTGACCANNQCSITTQAGCAGAYLGDYSICGILNYSGIGTQNAPLIDISATGTPGPAQGHNVLSDVIDLPFAFTFYDVPRTQLRYSTNGWLTFDLTQTDSAPGNPATLPNVASPNLTIAPLWDELVSDTDGPNRIFMETIGTAPDRRFVIQYNNVLKFGSSLRYTFQVLLYEGLDAIGQPHRIECRYSQFSTPAAGDAVIGVEDLAGQVGRIRALTTVSVGNSISFIGSYATRCQARGCCRGTTCTLTNQVSCQSFGGTYNSQATCAPSPCSLGACCLNNGGCQLMSALACAGQNGIYRGDDTTCQDPCPPVGSCCPADGSGVCSIALQVTCESAGGTWGGPGSTCSPNPCAGACCMRDGSCQLLGPAPCIAQGGPFHGVGVACEDVAPCPPAGACCANQYFADCTYLTEAACLEGGGYWQGANTTCGPDNDCLGVCCQRDGTCVKTAPVDCLISSGVFRGRGTDCATVDPPCPTAERCCLGFGVCMNVTQAECARLGGTPSGPGGILCGQTVYSAMQIAPDFTDISATGTRVIGTNADDVDAPFSIGFAFQFYDECVAKTAGRVGSNGLIVFTGLAQSFGNSPIPFASAPNDAIYPLWDDIDTRSGGVYVQTVGQFPNRVCILQWHNVVLPGLPDADSHPITFQCKLFEGTNCIEFHYLLLRAGRSASVGVENPAGTVGTSIPDADLGLGPSAFRLCPPRVGACCLPNGSCVVSMLSYCTSQRGFFRGEDTDCSAGCDPIGSCCPADGSGNCTTQSQASCLAAGGTWGGAGSSCESNPCVGACCLPNGQCQLLAPVQCYLAFGFPRGIGTDCATAGPCPPLGACCRPDGFCQFTFEAYCQYPGYTAWRGPNTTCDSGECVGACCLFDGACVTVNRLDCANQGGQFHGEGVACNPAEPCPVFSAVLSGSASGCAAQPHVLTVTFFGGTPPYTATLDNGGGTQTGTGPLQFIVSPSVTTTYAITSAVDSLNRPASPSGSATITILTQPDCNLNQIVDACDTAAIGASQDFSSPGGGAFRFNGNSGARIIDGACQLTPAVNGVYGTALFDSLTNLPVGSFAASFDFKIGGGNGADGLSFSMMDHATHDDLTAFGETGPGGAAITVQFNTYQNEGEPSNNYVALLHDGNTLAVYFPTFDLRNYQWNHASINFDGSAITVILTSAGGLPETAFNALPVPGYVPSAGRYGLGARTGGLNDEHWVDNVMFAVTSATNDCNANLTPDDCERLTLPQFVMVLLQLDESPEHVCLADRNRDGQADGDDVSPYMNGD